MKAILFIYILSVNTGNVSLETVEFDSYEACKEVREFHKDLETTDYSVVSVLCHHNYQKEIITFR